MQELEHSAKGSTWKNHAYTAIRMVNGKKRYIYDFAKKIGEGSDNMVRLTGKKPTYRGVKGPVKSISRAAKRTGFSGGYAVGLTSAIYNSKKEAEGKTEKGPKNTPKKRTLNNAFTAARLKTTVDKVSKTSINSSVSNKVIKALQSAVNRTRTSPDRVTETKSGSKITNYGVYSNYEKKKRYQ